MNGPAGSLSGFSLPVSATAEITFGAQTHRGVTRTLNEDHYLVVRLGRSQETVLTSLPDEMLSRRFDEYGYAMIIADGMGASGSGEAASRLALVTLDHLITHFSRWNLRIDEHIAREIMARAERFYRHVDGTITAQRRNGAPTNGQTTLTAAFGAGHDLFFAHVGHSRAYLFRGQQLLRLTRDHTLARHHSRSVATAPLVDVNAGARDLAHILTDTIGMAGTTGPAIDIERLFVGDGDRVLVCTNGLTDAIDEDTIADVLGSSQSPNDMCRALVDLAAARGGEDDTTVIVGHYRFPE